MKIILELDSIEVSIKSDYEAIDDIMRMTASGLISLGFSKESVISGMESYLEEMGGCNE